MEFRNHAEWNRLRWQCRRGLLELDLLLGDYLADHYDSLNPIERGLFQELLMMPDQTLLKWLHRQNEPQDRFKIIIKKIVQDIEY